MDDRHIPSRSAWARSELQAARWAQRANILLALAEMGPREVYAGLIWIREMKGHKPGWVAWTFKELFGGWPRPQGEVKPVRPRIELEEWLAQRPKRRRAAAATHASRRPWGIQTSPNRFAR